MDEKASLTLLGHVAVEVLLGPEAAEEVLGYVFLGCSMVVRLIEFLNY